MIQAYASLPHYREHLAPIVEALPPGVFGEWWAPMRRPWGRPLGREDRSGHLWLVAGASDVQRLGPGVPCVLVSHGADQSYHGDETAARHPSYAGGNGMEQVRLFVCPSESSAQRWLARYPEARTVVAGCAKLDRWNRESRIANRDFANRQSGPLRVAVAMHWPNSLCPEAGTAWSHYRPVMPDLRDALAARGAELVGHGHPRWWRQYRTDWARMGVRAVEDFAAVMDEADVLVVDNSSTGPEFASTRKPIIWVSAPWWRRDVDHGGRFWSWVQGMPHVEEPEQLVPTVLTVLDHPERHAAAQARMVASVYAHTDGRAAERAAAAIMQVPLPS